MRGCKVPIIRQLCDEGAVNVVNLCIYFVTRKRKDRVPKSADQALHENDTAEDFPSSVEVKNAWSYTSTLQIRLHGMCLVKHRDTFTFT
jgi:hypothetical protein